MHGMYNYIPETNHVSSVYSVQLFCIYNLFFFLWRDSPLVGLGLLLIHEDFCGF